MAQWRAAGTRLARLRPDQSLSVARQAVQEAAELLGTRAGQPIRFDPAWCNWVPREDFRAQLVDPLQRIDKLLSPSASADGSDCVAAARTLSAELPRCLLHASQQLVTWSPPSRLRLARTLEAYMPYLTWYRLVANTLANHGDPSAPVVPDALSLWPNQMQAVSVPALLGIIQQAADDAASLMLEKYGVGAPIHVEKKDGDASDCHHLLAVPEHLAYAYTEVCKNALGAMHRRYGSDCDLEAPVVATLAVRADPEPAIVVTIVDQGDGLSRTSVPDAMRWFATGSAPVEREPSYTFSGDFGGELSGKGTGMPLSRCYQTVAGGQLHLEPTTRQRGCKVTCVHPLLSGSK